MNNPTVPPNPIACVCGIDHRQAGNRNCVVFVILNELTGAINEFLEAQDVLEFGKDGPMVYCLRRYTMWYYRHAIRNFEKFQAISEQHPEWHLAEQISRLRRYFDQVADDCAEAKNDMARPNPHADDILEYRLDDEEKTLRDAKRAVVFCFQYYEDLIEEEVHAEMPSVREWEDPDGILQQVDVPYGDARDAIMLLPESEKVTAERLTKYLDRIRKETLRLYEFRRTLQVIYQSDGAQINAYRR